LKKALEELEKLTRHTTKADYYYELETLTDNYRTLLRYAFEGYDDPQRQAILDGICASMLGLADDIRQSLLEPVLPVKRSEKQLLSGEYSDDQQVAAVRIEEIFFHREVQKLVEEAGLLPAGQADRIFKFFWLSDNFTEDHLRLTRQINQSDQVEWHEKCLVVSALTLSMLSHFDQNKLLLLLEFTDAGENQVFQRALTGLLLGLITYDKRLPFYPALVEKVRALLADETILPEVELILMQLLMARETDKITREFEEEVLPEMKKMMPKIEDKLQLDDMSDDEEMEGKTRAGKT
jgi:hypothetical protein